MKKIFLRILLPITLIVIIYFSFLHFKIVKYAETPIPNNADYLIILGTRVIGDSPSDLLQERIDTAAKYLKDNKDTIAIASGGQGSNEDISEAEAIKKSLIEQGIENNRIIVEDESTRTTENISYSKKLIPDKANTGIVVSNYFHLYRARSLAADQGLELHSLPASTPHLSKPKWYIREYLAITKYYLEKSGVIN